MTSGERLRKLRDKLGFTLKDVEDASLRLSADRENMRYWVAQSRLSNIESKGVLPGIYKLEALAIIYRRSICELLEWYGIERQTISTVAPVRKTHLIESARVETCELPVRFDPLFDEKRTSYIRRMIQEWGVRPIAALHALQNTEYTYGYVGTEDYTLYPMILPGSFVQVDQKLISIETGPWVSDFERPVYFLETHDSYICGWCALISSREIQVQPHALSGLPARNFRYPDEIEVVGRVVGIAMKLKSGMREPERETLAIPVQS